MQILLFLYISFCKSALEHTYAMIKPGYENLWGIIIQRIIDEGFQIIQMKELKFDEKLASLFYAEHVSKPFFNDLSNYITSGPVVALDLAREDAISKWRDMIGPTKKEVAIEKSPNSLRALYARSTTENLCHGSDSLESAKREIRLIFGDDGLNSKNSNNDL